MKPNPLVQSGRTGHSEGAARNEAKAKKVKRVVCR